jgi:hypothetical protein
VKRTLLCWALAAVLIACGRAGGQTASLTSPSPRTFAAASPSPAPGAPSESPTPSAAGPSLATGSRVACAPPFAVPSRPPSPSQAGSIEALSIVYASGPVTIHLITIAGGATTDRLLMANQDVAVLDANRRIALIAICRSTQLATLDLNTGAIRLFDVSSPENISWGLLSPDGSKAAVLVRLAGFVEYDFGIVDLNSGASSVLLHLPPNVYNSAGLIPLRWTSSGILVGPGAWDCARFKLLTLDPQSAQLTPITDVRVDAVSPDGTMMAAAGHADLGDVGNYGQCGWTNLITRGPVGGPYSPIAQEKNRAFWVFDVANDGSVLYGSDDGHFYAQSQASAGRVTAPPAPDAGVYLETGGSSIQQLPESATAQWWTAGKLLGPGQALMARQVAGGDSGVLEVDLVGLCTSHSGCTPSVQPVETDSGSYPTADLILLRS